MKRGATPRKSVRLAVVGDVHLRWNDADVEYFDDSDYDAVIFVGDIGSYRHKHTLEVARSISRLRKPALFVPGNHDGVVAPQLLAEVLRNDVAVWLMSPLQPHLFEQLSGALGDVTAAGYSHHRVGDVTLIVGRPHSMGGSYIAYAPLIERRYGIRSMEESAARLKALVDQTGDERIVFVAHNGPTGLGQHRTDIWGCDFKPGAGDFGDADLEQAVAYAIEKGKTVLAVIAGHMHHRLKGGGEREWRKNRDGVLYVNAARVPRIFRRERKKLHHHVRVTVLSDHATAEEVLVPE
ncbi:MAG: metallophosphoesterase family protein [Myxococcales bacterium]|nr:metallophosphoesterase family protein [Myxococcales bacterium]MCB9583307.1 metallophosphoesterase family protein [Polyangiaceae bacterium]